MKIKFNKVFKFDLTNKVMFGDLTIDELIEVYRDGRQSAPVMERQLVHWFPELIYVNKKGYDHIDKNSTKYDHKSFTKAGLKFPPSSMIGAGRKINKKIAKKHAITTNYICCDITNFPQVRVIFKTGYELMSQFPIKSVTERFHIPNTKNYKEQLFS
jgi:hypothetical protein